MTDLEERLGVRLLQRTTRTLGLTDEGRTYYDYCNRIVEDMVEGLRNWMDEKGFATIADFRGRRQFISIGILDFALRL